MKSIRIAIVGGGSAGPAAALFLKRQGHEVFLFEKVPKPSAVGAGVLLQPTGLQVLHELELGDFIESHGARVEALFSKNSHSKTLLDLHYGDIRPGLYGLGIHRGVLCEALFNSLSRQSIPNFCGVKIMDYQCDASQQVRLQDEEGKSYGPYDLLILAEGAKSNLRQKMKGFKRATPYPWGALWYIGEDRQNRFQGRLYQVVEGTELMVGFLPTGYSVNSKQPLVSFFYSVLNTKKDETRADFENVKKTVFRLVPEAQEVLEQIQDPNQLLYAGYWDVVMNQWHDGPVLAIGDAAHAMSPQLGQGVNLGLYDAKVLAECVSESSTLPEALIHYESRRKRHLKFYQFATRWLTPFFQSNSKSLGVLRDVGFSFSQNFSFLKKEMVKGMAGIKRGIVRKDLRMNPLQKNRDES